MKDFTKKYITKYFIFGYLCILGTIILSVCTYLSFQLLKNPYNYILSVIIIIPAIILLRKFIIILVLTKKKKQFYDLAVIKSKNNEYDKKFFLKGMYDPCFRIIVKDVLTEYHMSDKYDDLKNEIKIQKIPIMED